MVASASISPMPAMSVPVVRKMLDAVQGSAPNRFSVSGTSTPNSPDAMQAPVIAARKLHRVAPYYLLALAPGVLAVVGLSVLMETSHQFSIRESYGSELTLYAVPFDVTSPAPWLVGMVLAVAGTWLFLRAGSLARNAYDEAIAHGSEG